MLALALYARRLRVNFSELGWKVNVITKKKKMYELGLAKRLEFSSSYMPLAISMSSVWYHTEPRETVAQGDIAGEISEGPGRGLAAKLRLHQP